jgi:hypothetical protein
MGKVTIFGKGRVGDRIESTYYREGDQILWSTTVGSAESWSGVFETNAPGDFESYYLFRFPGESPRRVFLPNGSLPVIEFEQVGNVPNFSPQPPPPDVPVALEIKRTLLQSFDLPPNEYRIVKFHAPTVLGGVAVAADETRTDLSLWFPSWLDNKLTLLDVNVYVDFDPEPSGDRGVFLGFLEYNSPPAFGALNPDGTLVRGNGGLSTRPVNPQSEDIQNMDLGGRYYGAASPIGQTTAIIQETGREFEDYSELQVIFYVAVFQNSPKTIKVERVSLSIINRHPGGV